MKLALIKKHFKDNDPAIFSIFEKMELKLLIPLKADSHIYFQKLCGEIVSQQLAGKAAEAIFNRFVKLLPSASFNPKQVLAIDSQAFRDAGLSWAKVKYI